MTAPRDYGIARCWLIALLILISGCGEQAISEQDNTDSRQDLDAPVAGLSPSIRPSENPAENAIRFGVLSIDSAVSVNRRYRPLLDYLQEKTGYAFELIPLSQESQFSEVENNNLEFIAHNPLAAVQTQRLYKTEFLVTISRPKTGTKFSAAIIVRAQSDVKAIADLKNKKAACVNFKAAAAGCTFQMLHLKQRGFNPFKDFASFIEIPSQDNIVLAVLNGTVDVGFIRTGQLEKMQANGLVRSLEDIRILEPVDNDFFYPHTTALYPEWTIAALQDTDPELSDSVRQALLTIPEGHPALEASKYSGFVEPVDYSPIRLLIDELSLDRASEAE
ncbi:MAG: phosphate/phosphite/phosphonate ABC transporter substrate-binding protein [Cyanobacteria bacterium P01_D01_bin.73]